VFAEKTNQMHARPGTHRPHYKRSLIQFIRQHLSELRHHQFSAMPASQKISMKLVKKRTSSWQ